MNEWLPEGKLSLVSTNFFQRKAPLLWAWREAPALTNDSGWRFLSQADTTTSLKHSQAKLVSYEQVLALEPAIAFIYRYP
ncbi:immunity protein Imm33 domain-containing protein, partial [Streptococcus oralis]